MSEFCCDACQGSEFKRHTTLRVGDPRRPLPNGASRVVTTHICLGCGHEHDPSSEPSAPNHEE